MIEYACINVRGVTPGSIGYQDHPERRLGAVIERELNRAAQEGFTLDKFERLEAGDGERALLFMKRSRSASSAT